MKRNNMKRRGFTLVELLIVIVVIGILSAMMMLSSTEAVTSAKASNIVSDMRNLKTAALAYYVDNLDAFSSVATVNAASLDLKYITPYLNNSKISTTGYKLDQNASGDWYLEYTIQGTQTEKTSIQQKLAGRSKSVGLYNAQKQDTANLYSKNDATVYMFVR